MTKAPVSRLGWVFSALLGLFPSAGPAATFYVSTGIELQTALTTAQANGEDDVINAEPGTYYFASTLTYNAPTNENKTLTIQCPGGGAIIDAGGIESGAYRGLWITTSGTVAHVTLDGLTIRNGQTTSTDTGSGLGAGAFVYTRWGNITLQNCRILNNKAIEMFNPVNCAGAYLKLDNPPGTVTVCHCTFTNNFAKGTAGGLYVNAGSGVGASLINNLFVTNGASTKGGGAYIYLIDGTLTMDNNTFTKNYTGLGNGGGGAYISLWWESCVATLRNNILWSNVSDIGIGADVYFEDDANGNGIGATVNVYNCDFSDIDFHVSNRVFQGSNTNASPQLASDFHLRAASPCIDTGTNLSWMTGATDVDGQPRIFNDRVDMGVDETTVTNISLTVAGVVTTVWETVTDARCVLQYTADPVSGGWQPAGNTATAASRRITMTDTNPAAAMRLYSLKWLRP